MRETTEEEISTIDPFVANYRETLGQLRDANIAQLNQQRENDFAGIMSSANKAGVMYSNFPQRSKIQYDTQTYFPALTNIQTSYQTGLDSLREKGTSLTNQIKAYQDAIADMNKWANLYLTRANEK